MVSRGEAGLVFAGTGLQGGIFDEPHHASMVFVAAVTTLVAQIMLKGVSDGGKEG